MIEFHPADDAFQGAIDDGYLSDDPQADNYAGHFMYMGTEPKVSPHGLTDRDMFKHQITREYLRVPCTWIS